MRLGVLLPHRAVVLQSARRPPLEACWTVARMCDEARLDLWVGDSIVAKPRLEPLTTLAYLAAITQHARLGTAVLLPALRQPTVLAHALANIDQMSHGRLVLGLGVAWGERSTITMHCHQALRATDLALPCPHHHVVIRVAIGCHPF